MITLVVGESKCARKRGQHLGRRMRAALLFETGVIVGRDRGQAGNLVTAQAGCAAADAGRQPDVSWSEPLATVAQQVGEGGSIHVPRVPERRRRSQGRAVP